MMKPGSVKHQKQIMREVKDVVEVMRHRKIPDLLFREKIFSDNPDKYLDYVIDQLTSQDPSIQLPSKEEIYDHTVSSPTPDFRRWVTILFDSLLLRRMTEVAGEFEICDVWFRLRTAMNDLYREWLHKNPPHWSEATILRRQKTSQRAKDRVMIMARLTEEIEIHLSSVEDLENTSIKISFDAKQKNIECRAGVEINTSESSGVHTHVDFNNKIFNSDVEDIKEEKIEFPDMGTGFPYITEKCSFVPFTSSSIVEKAKDAIEENEDTINTIDAIKEKLQAIKRGSLITTGDTILHAEMSADIYDNSDNEEQNKSIENIKINQYIDMGDGICIPYNNNKIQHNNRTVESDMSFNNQYWKDPSG